MLMKLKKGVKKIIIIVVICLVVLSLGIYSFIKIKNKLAYEKTNEYKLTTIGYDLNTAKELIKTYQNAEINYILKQGKSDVYSTLAKTDYFIYDNFYDYLDYYQSEKDLSIRTIVEKVNTNSNKEYYTETNPADITKKELLLVNKYNYLSEDYVPDNLVTISLDYSYGELGSQKVTKETYEAFLNLWNASHANGYYLIINSSYRNYTDQQKEYDYYVKPNGSTYADAIAAHPGYSEHQTGLSIDVFEKGTGQKDFASSPSYQWLKENAHKYGFIERYPEDKVDITGYSYESWHYRYVGVEAATYIYENNITFDEYYAYFVK